MTAAQCMLYSVCSTAEDIHIKIHYFLKEIMELMSSKREIVKFFLITLNKLIEPQVGQI